MRKDQCPKPFRKISDPLKGEYGSTVLTRDHCARRCDLVRYHALPADASGRHTPNAVIQSVL
jgi:hypothetical protein